MIIMESTIQTALCSLQGLSVGDAFGESFFTADCRTRIKNRVLPPPIWHWTDDTQMAISVIEIIHQFGKINQDALAESFAQRFTMSPDRGYGFGAFGLLESLAHGASWRTEAQALFNGGSYGNGAAMRAAPIGGYFAGDPVRAAQEAKLSAEVTHSHPEGMAGAIAVAVAAAIAAIPDHLTGVDFIEAVLNFIPDGETRNGIAIAAQIPPADHSHAVEQLGNGSKVCAQDTVPYCIWCAAHNLNNFEQAMWVTVSGLGDRDTTCAIVGGIVGISAEIPQDWINSREPLPDDFLLARLTNGVHQK